MNDISISISPSNTPVTTLQFISHYLLSGQGSYCHVYNLKLNLKIGAFGILSSGSIHGIRPFNLVNNCNTQQSVKLCIFGGHCLHIATFDIVSGRILDSLDDIHLSDWIWDCQWLFDDDAACNCNSSHIAAVLGHNSVVEVCWLTRNVLRHVFCVESCILYSAKLIGSKWLNLMCAAGTVFNQVLVWPVFGSTDSSGRVPYVQALNGHKGVITAIDFDAHNHKFCTASDDRSIRIWKLKFEIASGVVISLNDWTTCEFNEVTALFGHAARVWDVSILRDDSVVSIGEDATCCVWNHSGQIEYKFKGHKGKNIWSLAVNDDESFIATGGGDCSVRLWHRQQLALSSSQAIQTTWLDLASDQQEGEFVRIVKMLEPSIVLVMFNSGRLVSYDTKLSVLTNLVANERYSNYSVMAVSDGGNLVAIGNITGSLRVLFLSVTPSTSVACSMERQLYSDKVHSILWLDSFNGGRGVLATGPNGHMILLSVDDGGHSERLKHCYDLELPACKQRWVTTACIVQSRCMQLICGDRSGSVLVYSLPPPSVTSESQHGVVHRFLSSTQIFRHIHGSTGVTFVCHHGNEVYSCGRDGTFRGYAWAVGGHKLHNMTCTKVAKGFDWVSKLVFKVDEVHVLGFHHNCFIIHNATTNQQLVSVPCGGGHRAWDFKLTSDTLYLTYIQKRRVAVYHVPVLSYQTICEPSLHGQGVSSILHYDTDSRNNSHSLLTAGEDGRLNLIHVNESIDDECLSAVFKSTARHHVSSIRSLATSRCPSGYRVVFTAGGRGHVCAWRVPVVDDGDDGDVSLQLLASYPHRLSGVRKTRIKWTNVRYMSLSAFAARQLDGKLNVSLHIIIAVSSDGLIRLFCFDECTNVFHPMAALNFGCNCLLQVKHILHPLSCNSVAAAADESNQRRAFVLCAGTDGRLALWDVTDCIVKFCHKLSSSRDDDDVDEDGDGEVVDANECRSSDECESVSSLEEDDDDDDEKSRPNMSVDCQDGDVLSVEPTCTMPTCTIYAHQCGINAIAVRRMLDDDKVLYRVISGGDDNAIAVHDVEFTSTGVPQFTARLLHTTAHGAQITGVASLTDTLLVSGSVDQRVTIWKIDIQSKNYMLKPMKTVITDVADISGLECFQASRQYSDGRARFNIAVSGVGMQFLSLAINVDC